MKILVNTASSFKGGGIQVAKSYIEEFQKFSEHEYFVILGSNLAKIIDTESFSENFQFFKAPFRPASKLVSFQSHNYFLKRIEKEWKPDVVFSVAGPSYWRPKTKHIVGFTIPHYVYPESPYFDIISAKRRILWRARKMLAQYLFKRDADVLVTQTDDVSQRVKHFLNKKKVFTVSNTINTSYVNPIKVENKLAKKSDSEFRLLTLSAWYPHKNLIIIPKIADVLAHKGYANIKFIITLPENDFLKLPHNKSVINVGSVKIEDGASLYNECDVMFLPTLLECFSASYVEAMLMGKPIITSDIGFAHTVCDKAALYVDSMNAEDCAQKIIELYNNSSLQKKMIEKGKKRVSIFGSARDRAKRILEISEQIINEN